jgi:GNAT superfamily N-acetyltransferase
VTVESLTREQRDEAARVLVESFREYPYMRYVLRESGDDYEHHLETLVRFIVDPRLGRHHPVLGLVEDGRITGVATVVEPESQRGAEAVERLLGSLRATIGDSACARMALWERLGETARPLKPYHFLGTLGVLPGRQGGGRGRRLIDAVKRLARAHPTSRGVCLNTERSTNVGFYEHLGFELVGEADIEDIHSWCLFWRASGAL